MKDLVVVHCDTLILPTQFDDCTVTVTAQALIRAEHGQVFIANKRACVASDVEAVHLPATYVTAAFPTPGSGEVTLQVNSAAKRSHADGQPLLLRGDSFLAVFNIRVPATNPTPGVPPDVIRELKTPGSFQPGQFFVHAS
ncbi:hypothetical protein [Pseudomonas koreensis]|uniref:hypothetical protein n=1 Tax=Pseudomonas koreensis TaxID=198620 RepID=UPI003F841B71